MKQRGRKSVNLLALPIDASPPRLSAPKDLTKIERSLFDFIVDASPPLHFAVSDTPLLVSYVQATLMARSVAKPPTKLAEFERVVRLQAMLATKLRLSPQTRLNPETLARAHNNFAPNAVAPWESGDVA